jgi:hypothetical protein
MHGSPLPGMQAINTSNPVLIYNRMTQNSNEQDYLIIGNYVI